MIKINYHMISGSTIRVEANLVKSREELESDLINGIKEKEIMKMCHTLINMKYVESIEIIYD